MVVESLVPVFMLGLERGGRAMDEGHTVLNSSKPVILPGSPSSTSSCAVVLESIASALTKSQNTQDMLPPDLDDCE